MHQKKPSETHIRREPREGGNSRSRGISSSSCGVNSPVIYQKHSPKQQEQQQQPNFLVRNQPQPQRRTQTQAHVQIQIQIPPPTSPNSLLPVPSPLLLTHQQQPHSNLHHERIQKPNLSSPHKRPSITTTMINQSPSSLSHSPTLSSLHSHHHHKQPNFDKKPILNSTIPFAIRTIAHRVFCHLRHARLLCVHLRVLILISLPSLYFFFSNPSHFFILNFVFILVFSITLLIFLNLSIPRLPSIRLLLARSLPKKFSSARLAKKEGKPVVWSIGSKPKSEKKLKSGSWVQVYSNGDVYEGEFHKGKCSGSGVYYYCMSGRYEGDWVDEKYDGFGVETWAKGSRYRGQYRQGLRHGIGVYRFYTGDVYAGEWANGQCHGCGIHTCEDGSTYGGEFKWGVKHGLGHYHFRNGDRYAGEYFGDKMHGFGVYQFGNGHRYEGAWHEGRRQGLGMYTFRNGETQSGHWQNGVLDIPTTGNSCPGPFADNHSKVLNAVQEARRAAEKAYSVVKVDDRVNKAVAAANKAANAARVAAVKAVQNRVHHGNGDDMATPFV